MTTPKVTTFKWKNTPPTVISTMPRQVEEYQGGYVATAFGRGEGGGTRMYALGERDGVVVVFEDWWSRRMWALPRSRKTGRGNDD